MCTSNVCCFKFHHSLPVFLARFLVLSVSVAFLMSISSVCGVLVLHHFQRVSFISMISMWWTWYNLACVSYIRFRLYIFRSLELVVPLVVQPLGCSLCAQKPAGTLLWLTHIPLLVSVQRNRSHASDNMCLTYDWIKLIEKYQYFPFGLT